MGEKSRKELLAEMQAEIENEMKAEVAQEIAEAGGPDELLNELKWHQIIASCHTKTQPQKESEEELRKMRNAAVAFNTIQYLNNIKPSL